MRIALVFTKGTALGQLQNFLALTSFKHGQVCYFCYLASRKSALSLWLKQSVAQWAACAFFFFFFFFFCHAMLLITGIFRPISFSTPLILFGGFCHDMVATFGKWSFHLVSMC